jgi:hypothetical protein
VSLWFWSDEVYHRCFNPKGSLGVRKAVHEDFDHGPQVPCLVFGSRGLRDSVRSSRCSKARLPVPFPT